MDKHLISLILVPLFQICINIADKVIERVGGENAMNTALCKKGLHDWEKVPSYKYLRVCKRCEAIDDITTDGIDSDFRTRKEIFETAEKEE